jgi:hypothetical protein
VKTYAPEQDMTKDCDDDVRDQFRIPSWSWASVDGSVAYDFYYVAEGWQYTPLLLNCVKVESVSCQTTLPTDDTSAVTSGHAVLTGNLVPVELAVVLERPGGYERAFVRTKDLQCASLSLDRRMVVSILPGDRHLRCWTEGRCQNRCCKWKGGDFPLYALELFCWAASSDWPYIFEGEGYQLGMESWYLVVRQLPTVERVFERIGIGCWPAHSSPLYCPLFSDAKTATIKII